MQQAGSLSDCAVDTVSGLSFVEAIVGDIVGPVARDLMTTMCWWQCCLTASLFEASSLADAL